MAITAAELVVRVGADTTAAEQGLQRVNGQISSFGKQAAVTGGLLTAGVTVPLTAVAKTAVDTAGDYESAFNMMQAVSGANAEQMQRVADTAKALGADMALPATSAADAAAAMTELAKAGLSVNDTMAAAKGVLQLAAAGNLSEAEAAEIASNALNAFGLSGDKASEVANLLAAAANASSGEVTDMADSLKMSAAVAATAGIPVEELVAAISQMANAGIKGSDAGTSIKQMLLSLQAPTDKAAGLMEELGISVYDSTGKMLPLGDIIGQFSGKLGELSQEERNAALSTIFGSDAVRAANIILMSGTEKHEAMLDAVTREGAAADLAGAQMKGFKGALEGLKSQLETLLLDVAEPFLGVLEGLARKVADFIPKIQALNPNIRNAALAFAAVAAVAGPVVVALGFISMSLGALSAPILLVVAGIAALAAAWAGNFLGIRDITASVFGTISNTVQTVWPTVQAVITTVIETIRSVIEGALTAINDFWNAHGEQIMDTASTVWGAVQGFIDVAVNNIRAIVETVMDMVRTFWNENGANILDAANRVWNAIKDVITWVANAIWSVISTVMTAVQKFWSEHGEAMLRIAQNSWNIIRTVIETVINVIFDIIKAVVALIRGDWEGAWNAIKDIASVVWDGIKSVISSVMDSIRLIISTALDIIAPVWDKVWNGIKTTAENVWKGIVDVVKTSINSIIGGINSLLSAWNRIELKIPGFDVKIPEIDVPLVGKVGGGHLGWPGITVGTPDIPLIPLLGAGGIITRPTLAMLGEAGSEAVLPLSGDRLSVLADRIAEAIARRPSYTINANYRYQDERSLRDDLRLIQMLGAAI